MAITDTDEPHPTSTDLHLSRRQVEILTLIAQGCTNPEIAERLDLSANTVKTYIRTAYRKAGVRTRMQAVAWAIRHGYE